MKTKKKGFNRRETQCGRQRAAKEMNSQENQEVKIDKINSQSLEDTQVRYISQKYTLDKYTLEKYTWKNKLWKNKLWGYTLWEKKTLGKYTLGKYTLGGRWGRVEVNLLVDETFSSTNCRWKFFIYNYRAIGISALIHQL